MKKNIFTLIFSTLLLSSCSSSTPEDAVIGFTENMSKGEIEQAKEYATEAAASMLDLASSFGTMPLYPDYKCEILKDSIVNDNNVWVTFINQTGTEQEMQVVKIDGEWLVNMDLDK